MIFVVLHWVLVGTSLLVFGLFNSCRKNV